MIKNLDHQKNIPDNYYDSFNGMTLSGLRHDRIESYNISILYVNVGRMSVNVSEDLRFFEYYSFAHLYKGRGIFKIPGDSPMPFQSGQGVLIAPGFLHYYGQVEGTPFMEDNICFCGTGADFLFANGLLQNGIIDIGEFRIILPIYELIRTKKPLDRMKAGLLLQQLLIAQVEKNDNIANNVSSQDAIAILLSNISQNPARWWTVNDMAEQCNMSIDKFRSAFTQVTGQRPKQYLDMFKMDLAKNWLSKSSWTIDRISHHLGYEDCYHFSRRFKLLVGMSPDFFRRHRKIH